LEQVRLALHVANLDLQETQETIQFLQQLHQQVVVEELWKVEQVDLVVQVVEQEILTRPLQVQVVQLLLQVKVMLVVVHFVEQVVVEVDQQL
tara:strand:- start:426 stop:701 length:276 start_codon:yes stop_codon:yes gene_type:complete